MQKILPLPLLKSLLILITLFIVMGLSMQKVRANDDLPIVVVGAGTSGLSTAQKLQQAGKKVIVLEARSRLGGRIDSEKFDNITLDLGASWIHGIDGNPIWPIAEQNNIKTIVFNEDEEAFSFFHANGQPFSKEQNIVFTQFIEKVEEQLLQTPEHRPASQEIKKIIHTLDLNNSVLPQEELKTQLYAFFEYLANDPYATSLKKLTSHYPKYEGYFSGNEVIFPQGYSQIIQVLAQGLNIQKNTTVDSIELKKDHVVITDQHHQTYLASKVIVTVPLGVLKKNKIKFSPALPNNYQQAIKNIGFGSFNKVFLEFDQPIKLERNRDNPTIGSYFQYKGQWLSIIDLNNVYHKPIYLLFFGGPKGDWVNQSSDAKIWKYVHAAMLKNFADTPLQPKNIKVTRWGSDPYSYGSFSFPPPQYDEKYVATFNAPIQHQLYFAGEHCTIEHAGTVHGAYISGQETAQKILDNQ